MDIERRLAELDALAERSRRVLEDPRKQKWHHDSRMQLAQIEAEIERFRARVRQKSNEQVLPETDRSFARG